MADSDLPEGWIRKESRSHGGKYYYFNVHTQESQWDPPTVGPKVRASHILVKHNKSRRPSSWREKNITRSQEEAIEILKGYQSQLQSGSATFESIASQYSDCGSAQNGGDLGFFGPGEMQKPFEDTTFSLKVGETSGIISTDSGVHIILRTA
eukprot:TRINITY_DN2075_c0_g1_i1.p1 TRINITY_DN2075_c0_g1~~TRINITY_DN2075_c0_g1_i1.p1  ORF type:complete len:152 (-),score=28.64 TRINITY_DN2075_c0_g1_i1:115-570(-)